MATNNSSIKTVKIRSSYEEYDVVFFSDRITTTVTNNPHKVREWLHRMKFIYNNILCHYPLIFGLDIEWRPPFGPGHNPVATLQLCILERCLVFQIIHARFVPDSLMDFLSDNGNTFVGVGIKADMEKLERDYGIGRNANVVDLGEMAAVRYGKREMKSKGLKDLCKFVLGKEMDKPRKITLSEWDNKRLSIDQVKYACIDALVSYQIGAKLRANEFSPPAALVVRISELDRSSCYNDYHDGEPSAKRAKPNPRNSKPTEMANNVETLTYNIMCINNVRTTVTNDPSQVTEWISDMESISNDFLIFGLGVEWSPAFDSGHHNPVATLQICIRECCLIFQIIHSRYVPDSLKDFLANCAYTFVGVGVKLNFEKLERDYQIGRNANVVDLGDVAVHRYGREDLKNYELKNLFRHVFGREIEEPLLVTSKWDNWRLAIDQVIYACYVAAVSYKIGAKLRADDLDYKLNMCQRPNVHSSPNNFDLRRMLIQHFNVI